MTPRMREALAAADPYGLVRARAGWFRCGPGGGYGLEDPRWPDATVAGLCDRGCLRRTAADRMEITALGRRRLAQLGLGSPAATAPDHRSTA